jgi:hypothetical protein
MTSLTDAFKMVNVEVNQNSSKVIIQDSTVEATVVIESCLPKQILCVQAAVSLEATKDGKRQNDVPNASVQEQPVERKQNSAGRKQQSVQLQRNATGGIQHPKYVCSSACSIVTAKYIICILKKERQKRRNKSLCMFLTC